MKGEILGQEKPDQQKMSTFQNKSKQHKLYKTGKLNKIQMQKWTFNWVM